MIPNYEVLKERFHRKVKGFVPLTTRWIEKHTKRKKKYTKLHALNHREDDGKKAVFL